MTISSSAYGFSFIFKCDKMLLRMEAQQKCYSDGFQGKSFEKFIFVNVGFYETSQVLIFAYARVFVGIFGK